MSQLRIVLKFDLPYAGGLWCHIPRHGNEALYSDIPQFFLNKWNIININMECIALFIMNISLCQKKHLRFFQTLPSLSPQTYNDKDWGLHTHSAYRRGWTAQL